MTFKACPKCGHAPLPADQSLPAACPACGLILAKYGVAPPPKANIVEEARNERPPLFLYVPDQVAKPYWSLRVIALYLLAAWTLWIWWATDLRGGEIGASLLHMVLLPFHEAGHYLLFRWFGEFIMTLGGTLGQHLFPIVCGIALLRRGDPFGAALCLWLLGYSTLDMSIYMYDAFEPQLTLLDGRTGQDSDGHDWQNLFGDMGLLKRARGIGYFFAVVGYATMVAALAWGYKIVRLQRARLSDSPLAEEELEELGRLRK